MKTFTIDTDNNITSYASRKAARETGAGVFASEEQFAELVGPDNKRLVDIWNSITGVKPVSKFANRKVAAERIWKALQSLGEATAAPVPETPFDAAEAEAAQPEVPGTEPEQVEAETPRPLEDVTLRAEIEPVALTAPDTIEVVEPVANVGAPEPQGAPDASAGTKKPSRAKKAPKSAKGDKQAKATGVTREGSKTAQVVAMLQRKNGATLAEIMDQMGWQAHSVRGFVSGALKKAGYTVESFKSEKGERTYRINQ